METVPAHCNAFCSTYSAVLTQYSTGYFSFILREPLMLDDEAMAEVIKNDLILN